MIRIGHKAISFVMMQYPLLTSVDLHRSKPLISLAPFNLASIVFRVRGIVMSQSILFSQPVTNNLSNRCRSPPSHRCLHFYTVNAWTYEEVVYEIRACWHGCWGPQICEVTCGGSPHLSCKLDQLKIRDYMDRRVTSPTWGSPPPCKQALKYILSLFVCVKKISTNQKRVAHNSVKQKNANNGNYNLWSTDTNSVKQIK